MNYADASQGAQVVMATSTDERYPADNIVDGDYETFWPTTGLYPQEFVISLANAVTISKIQTNTTNVRKLTVERCEGPEPERFEKVFEVELKDKNGHLQVENHQVNTSAKYLKFVIGSGWDDFASVHTVSVLG